MVHGTWITSAMGLSALGTVPIPSADHQVLLAVIGDWNATGNSYIGVTNGQQWYLDWNGNGVLDSGVDKAYNFGAPGWKNVTGDWNR